LTQRANRAGRDAGPPRIKPLYKRLPHGPHRLDRSEVILHQRARIHGAMIEAVSQRGYERTSVKQVISLAGVSRRSFYEQFANKQESFLATFDLLAHQAAQQSRHVYLSTEGGLAERLRAAFRRLAQIAEHEYKPALLVLVEAQTAGAEGTLRLCKGIATCEQMLARGFAEAPDASALPTPIVRGIAGGLHGATANVIRHGPLDDSDALAEEMLRWTMRFQTPAAAQLTKQMVPRATRRMREISVTNTQLGNLKSRRSGDERERLLDNVLRLAALHEYRELTAPQIADEAGVGIDVFLASFTDRDECYMAAFDMIAAEIMSIAGDPRLADAEEWPHAVRRTIAKLMRYLSEHPLYARTIAQEAFFAGSNMVERDVELARTIATLLSAGAPSSAPRTTIALDAIAGAIWHTIRCQVVSGRIQLLGALSDYLAYIVLASYIDADAAIELLSGDSPA
jgi:AcrR family transcriptional regulator